MTLQKHQGYSLIELLVVIAFISILIGLLLAAIQKVRESSSRTRCQSNLKQIGLAMCSYHDFNGHLPPGISVNSGHGRFAYMGWGAYLLPYIEQDSLWKEIQAAFASDPDTANFYGHPPHLKILAMPLSIYTCPSDPRAPGPLQSNGKSYGMTSYVGVEGLDQYRKDGCLFKDSMVKISNILDGTSNTLLVAERPPPGEVMFGWWYRGWGQDKDGSAEMLLGAQEWNVILKSCPPGPYSYSHGKLDNLCDTFHYWSFHSSGANFLFADGSVKTVSYSLSEALPSLASRAGGEVTVPGL